MSLADSPFRSRIVRTANLRGCAFHWATLLADLLEGAREFLKADESGLLDPALPDEELVAMLLVAHKVLTHATTLADDLRSLRTEPAFALAERIDPKAAPQRIYKGKRA